MPQSCCGHSSVASQWFYIIRKQTCISFPSPLILINYVDMISIISFAEIQILYVYDLAYSAPKCRKARNVHIDCNDGVFKWYQNSHIFKWRDTVEFVCISYLSNTLQLPNFLMEQNVTSSSNGMRPDCLFLLVKKNSSAFK